MKLNRPNTVSGCQRKINKNKEFEISFYEMKKEIEKIRKKLIDEYLKSDQKRLYKLELS